MGAVLVMSTDFSTARTLGDTEAGAHAWWSIWERGYVSALPTLSRQYAAGIPASTSGTPDFIQAYALKYINLRVMETKYGDSPSALQRTMLASVETSLRNTGGFLTPQQTEAAIAIAQQLPENNQNCCVGSG